MARKSNGYSEYAETYVERYEGVTERAKERIYAAVATILEKNPDRKTLTILDYGGGNGRYISVAETLARVLKPKGITIDYYCYEPTFALLKSCEERLQQTLSNHHAHAELKETYRRSRNREQDPLSLLDNDAGSHYDSNNDDHRAPFRGPIYNNGNGLRVHLIGGGYDSPLAQRDALKTILPESPDLTLCMFGVLSHVPKQRSRQNVLSLLGEITNGPLLLSVPTRESHKEALAYYDRLRETNTAEAGLAEEPGDIFYTRPNGEKEPLRIYYHLYSKDELSADLESAGMQAKIGIASITNEAALRAAIPHNPNDFSYFPLHAAKEVARYKREKRDQNDAVAARELHQSEASETNATYFWAEALGEKAQKAGYSLMDLPKLSAKDTSDQWLAKLAQSAGTGAHTDKQVSVARR